MTRGYLMRTLRVFLAGTVISALIGASPLAVLAQADEATVTESPSPMTAEDVGSVDLSAVATGVATVGTSNQWYQTEPGVSPLDFATNNFGLTFEVDMDDPRLSGELETNRNLQTYDSGVYVGTGVGHLTNEGGSWDVAIRSFYDPVMAGRQVMTLTGDGGYEGLHAMLLLRMGGPVGWEVEGVIVPDPMPEPPEWVLPPAD
jgi:hypothetical protein